MKYLIVVAIALNIVSCNAPDRYKAKEDNESMEEMMRRINGTNTVIDKIPTSTIESMQEFADRGYIMQYKENNSIITMMGDFEEVEDTVFVYSRTYFSKIELECPSYSSADPAGLFSDSNAETIEALKKIEWK